MTLLEPDPDYDPDEPFDFDEAAAAKVTEWERLLVDVGQSEMNNMAALEGMDEDQLTYLGSLTYSPYEPPTNEDVNGTGT